MSNYALIKNDVVVNVIEWDGEAEFTVPDNQQLINISDISEPPGIGWSYSDGVFTAPPPPERSHDELVADAELQKYALLTAANNTIAPLQDAVDLEMATEEEKTQLTTLKKYRVLLSRVDTSKAPDINWPEKTQQQ
ncbi:tail fiber assembly protein [Atlantibacter hermannii]|nr:tail fiber assembly protein [Atlantibacter hermannii]